MNRLEAAIIVYQLLGEPSDVENFDDTLVVIPKIDDVSRRICKGEVKNLIDPNVIYQATELTFLRGAPQFYTLVQPVPLTADAAVGDTTLTLDTTNFANSGYVLVEGDLIKYTAKSATQLTGISTSDDTKISVAHYSGVIVHQLYSLPSNINKPYSLFYKGQRVEKTVPVPFEDERDGSGMYYRYAQLIRDVTNSINLLYIVGYETQGDRFALYRYNLYTSLTDDTTDSVIPDEYMREVVCPLVAAEILLENEEKEDASDKFMIAYSKLDEMYRYLGKPVLRRKQKARMDHRNTFSGIQRLHGRGRGVGRDTR